MDVPDCIGTTGPQTRTVAGENDRFSYDACRGVSLAQEGERGARVPWNEDNPHYTKPPDNWPATNLDRTNQNQVAKPSLLRQLYRASPLRLIFGDLTNPTKIGHVQFGVGTMPGYTSDVTRNGTLSDVIFGYSVYGGGPADEIARFVGSFEVSGSSNNLWGSSSSVSPYDISYSKDSNSRS